MTGPGREDPSEERAIGSRPVFRGRLLDVFVDRVETPEGHRSEREIVRHPGAAAVLPYFPSGVAGDGEPGVVLLRQYRYAPGSVLWEAPAGTLEPGEGPEGCARRELEEETGFVADRLEGLGRVYTSPGFTDEEVHIFLAPEPAPGEARPEEGEDLRPAEVAMVRALEMVEDGRIVDGKTVCALLRLDRRLREAAAGD